MFGWVRKSTLDRARAEIDRLRDLCSGRLDDCRKADAERAACDKLNVKLHVEVAYLESRLELLKESGDKIGRGYVQMADLIAKCWSICQEGGVDCEVERPLNNAIEALVGGVWLAAFNRGMLAEREVKRTSAA